MLADFVGGPLHGQTKFVRRAERVVSCSRVNNYAPAFLVSDIQKTSFDVFNYDLIHVTDTFCVYYMHGDTRHIPPMTAMEHWISKERQFEQQLCDGFDRPRLNESVALEGLANRKVIERAAKRFRKLKRYP